MKHLLCNRLLEYHKFENRKNVFANLLDIYMIVFAIVNHKFANIDHELLPDWLATGNVNY